MADDIQVEFSPDDRTQQKAAGPARWTAAQHKHRWPDEASPNVSQGGRGAAKSSSIRQRSELNIRKSSYGPSPADLLAVLSPNVSIFCQGKTEHSPNRPAYPNSSGYSLPFSSAELR